MTVLERFSDDDAAVERANEGPYGLAAGVWTRDLARAHRMARSLEAGIVWVNKWFDLPAGLPMGGIGDSGFGRELSPETLHEYSAPKADQHRPRRCAAAPVGRRVAARHRGGAHSTPGRNRKINLHSTQVTCLLSALGDEDRDIRTP